MRWTQTMYPAALWLHSWLRWLVLLGTIVVLVRSIRGLRAERAWTARDDGFSRGLVALVDLQLLVGLLLYLAVSPIVSSAWADFGGAMKSSVLRFFSLEHPFMMLLAVVVLHVGRVRLKRREQARGRFRMQLGTTAAFVVLIASSIPWPGLAHGRPWLRTSFGAFEPGPDPQAAPPAIYTERCAPCHGPSGRGNGVAAGSMRPSPRDFTDPAWQASRTDRHLGEVIARGGKAVEASPNMPAFPTTTDDELAALIAYIRSRRGQSP